MFVDESGVVFRVDVYWFVSFRPLFGFRFRCDVSMFYGGG